MSISLIIILLALAALLLFALEAFVIPGFGITGISAALCTIVADVLIYTEYGTGAAIAAILVSAAVVVGSLWWFSKSKALDRMSLHSTIDSTAATPAQLSVKVGDEGVALTRLALIGNATIDGRTVEVKSDGTFIDEGTPLVVTHVNEALILVHPKS